MTDIIVYGAGEYGKSAANRIGMYYASKVRLDSFVDSNVNGEWNRISIHGIEYVKTKDCPVVIAISDRRTVAEVYRRLKDLGVEQVYMFLNRMNPVYGSEDFLTSECISIKANPEDIIPHIETHAVDYCNLNCKACIHFSALYKKTEFDPGIIYRDIDAITAFKGGILSFYIMGGEPLLRDDLDEVIRYSRKRLPQSDIQVLTNGLLISRNMEKLWRCLNECNVTLTVSEYKPIKNRHSEIIEILEGYKVPYIIREYQEKEKFVKTISADVDTQYPKTCICDGCVNVYKGMVARCPAVMYLDHVNNAFQINLPQEGIFPISDFDSVSGLNDEMRKRIPLCDHCVLCEIDWEQCGKTKRIEDFVVV